MRRESGLRKTIGWAIVLIAVLVAVSAPAQEPNIGREAPELKIEGWATGKTLAQEDLEGRPYVLEFWATWCPPCRDSIPHLNSLSQRLEPFGLRIIGLTDQPLERVGEFANDMGMLYYVGAGHRVTGLQFSGIPFAFAVGADGKIEWAGHPLDPAFEEILWDLTRGFTPKALHPALKEAQSGSLGEVYEKLDDIEHPRAREARDIIAANLKLRLKRAAMLEGIRKYNALYEVNKLYEDVAGSEVAVRQMTELLEDPELKEQVEEQRPMRELEEAVQNLKAKAMEMEKEKSRDEAAQYYFEETAKLLRKFVEENPEHQRTPEIKESLEQIEGRLDGGED